MEEWKPARHPRLAPQYEVSTEGRIRNRMTGTVLEPTFGSLRNRRAKVCLLTTEGKYLSLSLAQIIAHTFLGPSPYVVRLKDGNLHNLRPDNLTYSTKRKHGGEITLSTRQASAASTPEEQIWAEILSQSTLDALRKEVMSKGKH